MQMSDIVDKTLSSALAGCLDWTDEQWAEHDRRVAEEREREAAEEAERRRAEARARRPRELIAAGVPPKLVERLEGVDESKPAVVQLEGLGNGREAAIRVLSGSVGTGKSMAAAWWLWHHGGPRPVFMRSSAFEAAGRYDREHRERWTGATAMVLDDLGMEYADTKGNFLADLDELVDHYAHGHATLIITTNLAMDDFKARYGARIVSRIRDSGQGCWRVVSGPDLRGAR